MATYEWIGGNGTFSASSKWTLSGHPGDNGVPGAGDIADFAQGGTISGDGAVFELSVEADVTFTGTMSASDTVAGMLVTGHIVLDGGAKLETTAIVTGAAANLQLLGGSTLSAGTNASGYSLDIGTGTASFADATVTAGAQVLIGDSSNGLAGSGTASVLVDSGAAVFAAETALGGEAGLFSDSADVGTLTLTGTQTHWANSGTSGVNAGAMVVGLSGTGTLLVEDGASLSDASDGDIGSAYSAHGCAKVNGAGSLWSNAHALYVGNGGAGSLAISGGGTVTSAGGYIAYGPTSFGSLLLTGAASLWTDSLTLFVGDAGYGCGTIDQGASAVIGAGVDPTVEASLLIGYTSGITGSLLVTGAGSDLKVYGQIDVGLSGDGSLTVSEGASVTSGSTDGTGIVVGYGSGGAGTLIVTGAGSTLTNTGYLNIANGNALLEVAGGASVTTSIAAGLGYDGMDIGYSGKTNEVAVTGAGSRLAVATSIVVGSGAGGTLSVTAGGTVTAGQFLAAQSEGSDAVVSVQGTGSVLRVGTLTLGAGSGGGSVTASIGSGGAIVVSGAFDGGNDVSLSLAGGDLSAAGMDLSGTSLRGYGTLTAASIQYGTATASGGTLAVSAGTLTLTQFTIGNTAALSFSGAVAASAAIAFGGTAHATLLLAAPQTFAAPIADFAKGDAIDLLDVTVASRSYAQGTLTLSLSSGNTAHLLFSGTQALSTFTFQGDGHGGIVIGHS